jgi:hypothetical protein
MKKAKSTIKRKFELEEAQSTFAEFGTKYIKRWTEQELKQYRTQPVVIPVGAHGFFVGQFRITGVHADCWTVEKMDGQHIHNFTSKSAAVIYCISEVRQKYEAAQTLLDLDTKLGRLELDIVQYEYTLSKTQDLVKSTVVLNRCIDAKMQRRDLLNILKKTLNSAKYLNFGKQPL